MSETRKRIHVVINPVSGKNEPILNVINNVFQKYDIEWTVSVTHKYGDATTFARRAAGEGYGIVAGYGGDGTQHEIANGLMGTDALMGVLPGGTGNGFANELGTPGTLGPAAELLCTSQNTRQVDVVKLNEAYFIQRLYVGIEPEQQTSREDKNKYGTFAYVINTFHQIRESEEIQFRITVDGEVLEGSAMKVYVVNAARAGTGISITGNISKVDDGLVDVFFLNAKSMRSIVGAADRMLNLNTKSAREFYRQGKKVTIEAEPDQPVWTDGEYTGRTPVSMKVLPRALNVIVP